GLRQPQATAAVVLPGVGAREEHDEVGAGAGDRLVEGALERGEVLVVAGATRQVDVEVRGLAMERVVRGGVDRERERERVGRAPRGGPASRSARAPGTRRCGRARGPPTTRRRRPRSRRATAPRRARADGGTSRTGTGGPRGAGWRSGREPRSARPLRPRNLG